MNAPIIQACRCDAVQADTPANENAETVQIEALEQISLVVRGLLARLQEGRARVEGTAGQQVQITRERIRQVSSTTEDAALNIMDSCDRALSLVDEFESAEGALEVHKPRDAHVCTRLRDELYGMMGALQFQDIIAQQLAHAAGLLDDMEQSLLELSRSFDLSRIHELSAAPLPKDDLTLAYDPNATTRDAAERQSLVDDLFAADQRGVGPVTYVRPTS